MKKKTKIFFFNPYPTIGGVDTVIKKFINSLDLRYYNIEYLTLKKCNYKFKKDIAHFLAKKIQANILLLKQFHIYFCLFSI